MLVKWSDTAEICWCGHYRSTRTPVLWQIFNWRIRHAGVTFCLFWQATCRAATKSWPWPSLTPIHLTFTMHWATVWCHHCLSLSDMHSQLSSNSLRWFAVVKVVCINRGRKELSQAKAKAQGPLGQEREMGSWGRGSKLAASPLPTSERVRRSTVSSQAGSSA